MTPRLSGLAAAAAALTTDSFGAPAVPMESVTSIATLPHGDGHLVNLTCGHRFVAHDKPFRGWRGRCPTCARVGR